MRREKIERNDNGNIVLTYNQDTFILCPMTYGNNNYFQICDNEYNQLIEYIPEQKTPGLVRLAKEMLRAYHLGLRRGTERGINAVTDDIKRALRIL